MNIPPIIRTPLNEEKNPKRNNEEESSSTMETSDELFKLNKRPKLNHVSEQEENIASEEIIDTEAMGREVKKQLKWLHQLKQTSHQPPIHR